MDSMDSKRSQSLDGEVLSHSKFVKVLLVKDTVIKIIALHKLPWYLQERYSNEGQHHLSLKHPNIVTCYSQKVQSFGLFDQLVIRMEYVPGLDLFEHCSELSPQPWEALSWMLQVARGLEYMHANNLCHGDLKPENILLSPWGQVKLCDFGMSIKVPETHHNFSKTLSLYGLGTKGYTAPEIILNNICRYNPLAADIWSFGACLGRLLTGSLPEYAIFWSRLEKLPAWQRQFIRSMLDWPWLRPHSFEVLKLLESKKN